MKFWQKIFVPVLLLFLILLNVCIYILYSITYQNHLDGEKNRTAAEQYAVSVALSRDFTVLEENDVLTQTSIRQLMNTYSSYYSEDGIYLRLYHNHEPMYLTDELPKDIVQPEESVVYTVEAMEKVFTCSSDHVLNYDSYHLVYIRDITKMEQTWDELTKIIVGASICASAVLSILLYFLISYLTNPISRLAKAADEVAEGVYDIEVPIKGRDEIAVLSKNFNHMTAQIGNHVQQLEDESRKKQMFMDNFTHELRTPLTNIYGYSEFMMRVLISEEDRLRYLDYIMHESKRLNIMSTELFNLTVLRNNDVEMSTVKCQSLLEAAANTLSEKLKQKKITLTVDETAASVFGSWALLESLVINFTENAIRACAENAMIRISFDVEGEKPTLRVKDNGKGMSEEQIAHITEPFYRVDKSRTRNEGGVGLGLYLCSEIVHLHKASLSFESKLGEGTEVIVRFPK